VEGKGVGEVMSIERFLGYAAAFEQAFESDDWSVLEPFFSGEAVYEVPGGPPFGKLVQGVDNIISSFRLDVNSFDRKFDRRIVKFLQPPYERGSVVHAHWRAVYKKEGLPDLELEGVEQADFEGDRIHRLVSDFDESKKEKVLEWLSEYSPSLGLGLGQAER
jgi:hypothetical protein